MKLSSQIKPISYLKSIAAQVVSELNRSQDDGYHPKW
ncbi:MAG: hypothetical protein ACI909_002392 [Planctomycetota bacterium]|jgi:hypothetical protein